MHNAHASVSVVQQLREYGATLTEGNDDDDDDEKRIRPVFRLAKHSQHSDGTQVDNLSTFYLA